MASIVDTSARTAAAGAELGQAGRIMPASSEDWRAFRTRHGHAAVLDGLFESDVIGLALFDLDQARTLRANDRLLKLLDASRAEFEGGERTCRTATPARFRALDGAALRQAAEGGRWAPYEKEYLHRDGRRVPVRLTSAPMPGLPRLIVCCVEDLTDRHRAEEQLRALQSEIEQLSRQSAMITMASIVVHEVAQPMIAVSNALSALEQLLTAHADPDDPRIARSLALARRQSDRAGDLLQRVRRFAAPDRRGARALPVRELVEEAAAIALHRCPDIELRVSTSSQARHVRGDPLQVQQVLLHLIRNAAEALEGRGRISVDIARADELVEIAIADDGPGFAAGTRDRAFDPFSSTKAGSTGLGLAICREIVERHGGTIAIDALASGARIVFTLPHQQAVE